MLLLSVMCLHVMRIERDCAGIDILKHEYYVYFTIWLCVMRTLSNCLGIDILKHECYISLTVVVCYENISNFPGIDILKT